MPGRRRRENPYLNYISPHLPLFKDVEQGQSQEDPIRIFDENEDGSNDAAAGCVYGCLNSMEFGCIAHYSAEDKPLLHSPHSSTLDSASPFVEPYDPILGQSSCKVVIVPTEDFYDSYNVDPDIWVPCWMVSLYATFLSTPN